MTFLDEVYGLVLDLLEYETWVRFVFLSFFGILDDSRGALMISMARAREKCRVRTARMRIKMCFSYVDDSAIGVASVNDGMASVASEVPSEAVGSSSDLAGGTK